MVRCAGYKLRALHLGSPYYADRAYSLNTLPQFLIGLKGIATRNDDKHIAKDARSPRKSAATLRCLILPVCPERIIRIESERVLLLLQVVFDTTTGHFTGGFICFTAQEQVRVYVLYDSRAIIKPIWLQTHFRDRHVEKIGHNDENMAKDTRNLP